VERIALSIVVIAVACRMGPLPDDPPEAGLWDEDEAPEDPAPRPPPIPTPAPVATEDAGPAPEGMLLVPGGTYKMGRDEGGEGDERPAHMVTVKSFWLDATEVTQQAYDACVAASVCRAPDPEQINVFHGLFRGPNKPVVGVSWHDATKYCAWKKKRLPTEAEFERAVRGDDGRKFAWGDDPPTHERTVFSTNGPEDVGTHPLGRGPYGHDDLAGNVWEWIDDDYDPIAYERGRVGTCDEIKATQDKLRKDGMQGFTGSNPIPTVCDKVIRGGAYNYPAWGVRSTNRVHHPAGFRLKMTGFRCARDAS